MSLYKKGEYVWANDEIYFITDVVSAHPHLGNYFYEVLRAHNGDYETILEHEIQRRALEYEMDFLRDKLFSQPL